MSEHRFDELHEDMDVLDAQGEKVGSVEDVYRPSGAPDDASPASRRPILGGLTAVARPGHIGVRSGLFGMGKYRYIPLSIIREVRDGAVCLDVTRDQLEEMDLDMMPAATATPEAELLAPNERLPAN